MPIAANTSWYATTLRLSGLNAIRAHRATRKTDSAGYAAITISTGTLVASVPRTGPIRNTQASESAASAATVASRIASMSPAAAASTGVAERAEREREEDVARES